MKYKDIKTFFERCQDDPNHQNGRISEFTIRQRLMDEIVELRNYIEQTENQEPVRNRSDCGHTEYKPLCQMCMATKQEPVAWMTNSEQDVTAEFLFSHVQTPMHNIPLYEAPPQAEKQEPVRWFQQFGDSPPHKKWVGLTDDDLRQIILVSIGVAEAKLKEKNNG